MHQTSRQNPTAGIFLLKLVHSLIYIFMSACVGYLFYASMTATYDWKLIFAVGMIGLEGVVLLLSGRRCPLSTLAKRLGDESGNDLIGDYLLPGPCARRCRFARSSLLPGWFYCSFRICYVPSQGQRKGVVKWLRFHQKKGIFLLFTVWVLWFKPVWSFMRGLERFTRAHWS